MAIFGGFWRKCCPPVHRTTADCSRRLSCLMNRGYCKNKSLKGQGEFSREAGIGVTRDRQKNKNKMPTWHTWEQARGSTDRRVISQDEALPATTASSTHLPFSHSPVNASAQNSARLGACEPHPRLSLMAASLLSPRHGGCSQSLTRLFRGVQKRQLLSQCFKSQDSFLQVDATLKKGRGSYLLDISDSKSHDI